MIIKSKRIRARGTALSRALRHLTNGDENDKVELIRGNIRDLEDARSDALKFGREYAVRHWILSPAAPITDEQFGDLMDRLATEFGFDPRRAVAWRHTKDRATESASNQHYHLCAGEIDPATGGVLSTSHDYRRHEKLARTVERLWGHAVVPGRHTAAVVAALNNEGLAETADALHKATPLDHPAAFGEQHQQRVKRAGYDLPRLREMVAGALSSATDLADFETKLVAIGLRMRSGDRKGLPIIEAIGDGTVIGSLARLTRLRKEALQQRMKFDAAAKPTTRPTAQTQADNSRSDVSPCQTHEPTAGAGVEAGVGCRGTGPARPDECSDQPVAAERSRDRAAAFPAGASGSAVGPADGREDAQRRSAWLKLATGCVQHQTQLLDLLGIARRAALPPKERVVFDLDGIIECETLALRAPSPLPEPASLQAAQHQLEKAAHRLRSLKAECDNALDTSTTSRWQPRWRRLFGLGDDAKTEALAKRGDDRQRQLLKAHAAAAAAERALRTEVTKFRLAEAQHQSGAVVRRSQAERHIATAQAARSLIGKNPRFAWCGVGQILWITAEIQKAHAEVHSADEPEDLDFTLDLDIWGMPVPRRPKVF